MDCQIPKVRQPRQQCKRIIGFWIFQIDGEPCGNGGPVPDNLFRVFDDFRHKTHAVLQASAVFITARIGIRIQKFRQQITVCGVDIDNIEPRLQRAQGRIAVPFADVPDVLLVNPAGLAGMEHAAVGLRSVAQAQRRHPRGKVDRHATTNPQFDTSQRTMFMHCVCHQSMGIDIFRPPQRGIGVAFVVRTGVDRTIFGIHDAPATFCLDPPHRRQRIRTPPAHPRAMGHLIKAVFGRDRPDLDRLKQNIVYRIAHKLALRFRVFFNFI